MKNIFVLVCCFVINTVFGQQDNYTITYNVSENLYAKSEYTYKLYVSEKDNKSLYKGITLLSEVLPPREPNTIYTPNKSPFFSAFCYFDFNSDLLYSYIKPFDKPVFIKEPLPAMDWQLVDETKTIENGVVLHKATLSFRGRNYTAWYSTDYPIQVGPWKFHNLPGLAFEITEESNQYRWQLTKIEQDSFKVLPLQHDLSRGNVSIESYPAVYKEGYDSSKASMSRMFSGIIPGVEIIEIEDAKQEEENYKKVLNNELERKFEWEK